MVGRGLGDLYLQLSTIHIHTARIAGGRNLLLLKCLISVFGPNILINQSFYKGRMTLNSSEGKRRNNTESDRKWSELWLWPYYSVQTEIFLYLY